ncbi:MAG: hypothetical protein ABR598_03165 [Candidatus Dormibacteria bacterium]
MTQNAPRRARFQGASGAVLVAVAWTASWSHLRPWSDFGFFPLWLGYIVMVDAGVRHRVGRSLLGAGRRTVLTAFLASGAMWWMFELINLRTDNWHYLRAAPVGPVRFALESSIDFSTVLPAVLGTAALLSTLLPGPPTDVAGGKELPRFLPELSVALGAVGVLLTLAQPHYFFPLVWVGPFFVLDGLNAARGAPSLLASAYRGSWRPLLVLALAGLTCGVFWEMWNWRSMPKWFYTVPLVPQQRLFEMPWPGYAGYIPFSWECFAAYILVMSIVRPSTASAVDGHFLPARARQETTSPAR